MATKSTKITQITKDFAMKSKDVLEIFKSLGVEKKSGGSADDVEFARFFQKVTRENQIENIDEYLDGKATIKVPASEKKAAAPEAPAAPKAEPVKAKAEPSPTPAAKAEPKPEPVKAPEVHAEQKPAAPAKETATQTQAPATRQPEQRTPVTGNGDRRPMGAPATGAPQGDRRAPQAPGDRRPGGSFTGGQGQNRPFPPRDDRRAPGQGQRDDRPRYNRYNEKPQENPFAKKYDNMTRAAQGFKNPNAKVPNPPRQVSTARPAQQAQLEKQQRLEKQQAQVAAQQKPAAPKKEEKQRAQKQELKKITPTIDKSTVQGGVNIGATLEENAPKTRVVDTRTSDVNLSKYDDRYSDRFFAIANGTDTKAAKQKLKKQDNRGQFAKSAKDKERAAQEKIKRMEAELARKKQLEITVPDEITVSELASRLKKTAAEVIKKLMMMGEMKGVNDVVDYATAELIGDAFGAKVTKEVVVTIEEKLFTEAEENEADLVERAPVGCVMG
ncbi:MAG TPA: hypothetical protein DDY70_04255, partial [Clostridiales bacterium]|nr:hypothetical protein [Clostridiales bacterium]